MHLHSFYAFPYCQNGFTALHGAAFDGLVDIAKLLLSRGADVDARDNVRGKI